MENELNRKKRILVLKACGGEAEPHECNGICEQATLYGIETVCKDIRSNKELEGVLSSNGEFDYIYLSAHGCADSFESGDASVSMSWSDFAGILCTANCMKDDSILMLSCCRGGLMQVAYTIFYSCSHICYVLGPRQDLASIDMYICFGIFLYNLEQRGLDPVVSCEKIKSATDIRFSCYDRQEEEGNIESYFNSDRIYDIYERICLNE